MTIENPKIIYGTAWKKGDTVRLVQEAIGHGFVAIDTANQPKHYDEPLVGKALSPLFREGLSRDSLYLQTKFTPIDGQDQRVPYDPNADYATQVRQSFASSLEHLGTDYLDSYLLHGPYSHPDLIEADFEVWREMEKIFHAGKAKRIGISNVNHQQLERLIEAAEVPPAVVQNRCYAVRGWDRAVRELCVAKGIVYQGFSLLTANSHVVQHPVVAAIAAHYGATAEQVIYRFSVSLQIVPLSGTTKGKHMREALESSLLNLSDEEVLAIQRIS